MLDLTPEHLQKLRYKMTPEHQKALFDGLQELRAERLRAHWANHHKFLLEIEERYDDPPEKIRKLREKNVQLLAKNQQLQQKNAQLQDNCQQLQQKYQQLHEESVTLMQHHSAQQ